MPKNNDIYEYRPRINRVEDLNRLADEIKSTPADIVNFCLDVGIEVLSKANGELRKEFQKKIIKYLK